MPRTFQPAFPGAEKQLAELGYRLRLARMRRIIPAGLFAQRMGISRDTLNRLEKGDPTIAIGTYLRALRVLGLERDLDAVARDDELGRKLQDLKLVAHERRKGELLGRVELVDTREGEVLAEMRTLAPKRRPR